MNAQENNKLIAEFWGMELGIDKTMYYDDAENLHPPTPINELKFHTSWNWLMPVVEKILSKANDDELIERFYEIQDAIPNLEATYKAVVEFINEYNQNK